MAANPKAQDEHQKNCAHATFMRTTCIYCLGCTYETTSDCKGVLTSASSSLSAYCATTLHSTSICSVLPHRLKPPLYLLSVGLLSTYRNITQRTQVQVSLMFIVVKLIR